MIKLFVALGNLSRADRYFEKLKEADFAPTYDVYRSMITFYLVSGRLVKSKEIYKEAENTGFITCGKRLLFFYYRIAPLICVSFSR